LLHDVNRQAGGDSDDVPDVAVNFGITDQFADWRDASQQLKNMLAHLQQMIAHAAWVETEMQEQLIGRSVVSWTGHTRTVKQTTATLKQAQFHQRSLSLALSSRLTMMRTIISIAEGATKVSALLTVPGGAVLALPVVWKYVNQILSEVQQFQAIQN
ncbi:MAG: hypothetical protein AAF629_19110, partial [Chloroflexota bacterium]